MSATLLRDFLEIPYEQLEELNLEAKQQRLDRKPADDEQEERMSYLS
jgi:glutamine synthetase